MVRTITLVAVALASLVLYVGCSQQAKQPAGSASAVTPAAPQAVAHEHKPGGHGGRIVEIGQDTAHAEAIFAGEGVVKIYLLGKDAGRVLEVEAQPLEGFAQADDMEDQPVTLQPVRQAGDANGKASMFMVKLPETLWGKPVTLTVPVTIDGARYRFQVASKPAAHEDDPMPDKVAGAKERALYLTPGGKYTDADIAANGMKTASQKFKGQHASHDIKPRSGDRICPITMTKANPKFSWIIDGQEYQFCCPPCVDEFVQAAKEQPGEIKPAAMYTKK